MSAKLKTAQKNKELVIELIADVIAIYAKLSTSSPILMSASVVSTRVNVNWVTKAERLWRFLDPQQIFPNPECIGKCYKSNQFY
jgi:hypothetical protein